MICRKYKIVHTRNPSCLLPIFLLFFQAAPMDVDGEKSGEETTPPAANGSASPPAAENGTAAAAAASPEAPPAAAEVKAEAKADEGTKKKVYSKVRWPSYV